MKQLEDLIKSAGRYICIDIFMPKHAQETATKKKRKNKKKKKIKKNKKETVAGFHVVLATLLF